MYLIPTQYEILRISLSSSSSNIVLGCINHSRSPSIHNIIRYCSCWISSYILHMPSVKHCRFWINFGHLLLFFGLPSPTSCEKHYTHSVYTLLISLFIWRFLRKEERKKGGREEGRIQLNSHRITSSYYILERNYTYHPNIPHLQGEERVTKGFHLQNLRGN